MQNTPLPSSANQAIINNAAASAAAMKKNSNPPAKTEASEFQRMLARQSKHDANKAAESKEPLAQRQPQQLTVKPGEESLEANLQLANALITPPPAEIPDVAGGGDAELDKTLPEQASEGGSPLPQELAQLVQATAENSPEIAAVPVTPRVAPRADVMEDELVLQDKPELLLDKEALNKGRFTKAEADIPFEKTVTVKAMPDVAVASSPLTDSAKDSNQFADALAKVNLQVPAAIAPSVTQASLAQSGAVDMRSTQIAVPFGQQGWNQAIGQKVVWMAAGGEQTASLTLNPPDLGPLQVIIHVHNNQADTTFLSDQADVRRALEDGMANLRDMMGQSGLQLGQTNVRSGERDTQAQQQGGNGTTAASTGTTDGNDNSQVLAKAARVMGLVDTFA